MTHSWKLWGRRRITAVLAIALVALGIGAGSASAAYDEYINGWLNGTATAPWHTLTEASARNVYGGRLLCTSAFERSGASVGLDCTSAVNGLAVQPYCGCALRQGVVSTGGNTLFVRARVTF